MKAMYSKSGTNFYPTSAEKMDLHEKLPPGNYLVVKDPMSNQLFLSQADPFTSPPKLYGNTRQMAERILTSFDKRPHTTGALLAGEKGSGKTLLARTTSILGAARGLPTILINAPYGGDGFLRFVQEITQPAIFLFDEFEKVYDKDEQQGILTLLDGVFPSKKLFLLTCNDRWQIDQNMINRPGRLFYFLEFGGVSEKFIDEYCRDNLKNQKHAPALKRLRRLFDAFNFDMLQAIVEEMNRYDESPLQALEVLNIKPYKKEADFTARVFQGSQQLPTEYPETTADPFHEPFRITYFQSEEHQKSYKRSFVSLSPTDLLETDLEKGEFVFQKDNLRVVLTEDNRPRKRFDYTRHLACGYD